LSDTSSSVLESLRAYIQTELEGHRFYQKAAENTGDSLGKQTFQALAADEIEHARRLSREYSSVSESGRWLSQEELSEEKRQGKEAPYPVLQTDAQGVAAIPDGANDIEALKIAIDVEKASWETYSKAANEAPNESAKSFFQHLMTEENRHMKILQSSLNYLTDTGGWFQDLEKPIFEG
jgi:rubrerythrin